MQELSVRDLKIVELLTQGWCQKSHSERIDYQPLDTVQTALQYSQNHRRTEHS